MIQIDRNTTVNDLFGNNRSVHTDGPVYISKKERTKQLIESKEFKDAFNLYHGKGKRKKKKKRK